MDSIVQYDTPLVRFKKELWNLCLSMKIFSHIPENKVDNAKEIFETIVSNYQNQILQQQGKGNDSMIKQTLLTELNKELTPLKEMTRDSIQQNKQTQFDKQLKEKEKEFNSDMQQNRPPPLPAFGDETSDEPLDKENLDMMIQQQMKERENVMNLNHLDDNANHVVATNNVYSPNPIQTPVVVSQDSNTSFIQDIHTKVDKIEKHIQIQSQILQQIVESQIKLLNKLK
mgnify:CR=1 FL=1